MAYAQPPPMAAMSPFWSLAYRFERIGYEFKGIYEKIEDVWLLGKYLRWPFYFIQYAFFTARDLSFDANIWVRKTKASIDALYDGWMFANLLDDLSYHYKWLRNDRYGWLKHHLTGLSYDLAAIITSAQAWFELKLRGISWTLRYFIDNPTECLKYLMNYAYPSVITFLSSPWGALTNWIYTLFPLFREFILSPNSLIISLISNWYPFFSNFLNSPMSTVMGLIKGFSYDLRLLINNPWFWFKHKLATALLVSVGDLDNMPVAIIKKIFYVIMQNQLGMIDYIRNVVCDLVLRYI